MCRSTHDANELALFVSREPHHADALLQVGSAPCGAMSCHAVSCRVMSRASRTTHADVLLQVGGRVSTMPYARALRAPRFQHARPPPRADGAAVVAATRWRQPPPSLR